MAQKDRLVSQFFIKIGGKVITDLMSDVIDVVVDDSLYLPDMFTIRVKDNNLKWTDSSDLLAIGKEVEISAQAPGERGIKSGGDFLIRGEITALEPRFSPTSQPTLLIRGYDRAHRLHRGRYTRSFLQVTDSEIVSKIAQEVGLRTDLDSTTTAHDYVFQNNQTNMEFLLSRAQRIGYQLYVEDKTLHFHKGGKEHGTGPELQWGQTLLDFQIRLTAVHQPSEIFVRGWDPKTKKEIVGRAQNGSSMPKVGVKETGGKLAQQAFGGAAPVVVANRPVRVQKEADIMAQALCDEIGGEFIKAEGSSLGDPRIRAGSSVTIKNLGQRFSGEYFVTSATHTYNAERGYETTFSVTGRKPAILGPYSFQEDDDGRGWGLLRGVVVGLVTNNKDPEGMGRVKVKYPWLDDKEESTWARISTPMAGPGRGFYYLPEINDEVLLAFEHGNIHRPYIVGSLWNGKDSPPKPNDQVVGGDGKVNERIIQSRSGHVIILDDTDGQEQIIICDKTKKNKIVIDSKENTITVSVGKDFVVEAQGNIEEKSQGDRTVESQNRLSIKSMSDLTLKSQANLTIEAVGQLKIKGNVVAIDGGPMTEVKGGMIKLN